MSQPEFQALGDVAEQVVVGYVGPSSAHFRSTGVPFLRTGNVGTREIDLQGLNFVTESFHKSQRKSQLRTGDVVITRVVSTEINCAIVPSELDGANCGNIIVVRPGSRLDSSFLAHLLCSKRSQAILMSRQVGSAQSVVNTGVLKSWEIPVPPIEAQRRIAAILDQADALRAKRREALAQLDSLTQSIFIEMFGDYRSAGVAWPIRPLEDIAAEMTIGLVRSAAEFGPDFEVPYVRMNAIGQRGEFLPNLVLRTAVSKDEFERYELRPGDLLFNTRNSRELVGKTALFRESGRYVFNNNLMRIRFHDGVHPEYVAAAFQTPYIQQELETRKAGTTSVFAIYSRELKTVPVPVPPFSLQQTFATRIQAVESLKTTHRAALAELDALFASLQHRAFAGQLS